MAEERPQEFFEIVNHTLKKKVDTLMTQPIRAGRLIMVLVKEHTLM